MLIEGEYLRLYYVQNNSASLELFIDFNCVSITKVVNNPNFLTFRILLYE